MNDIIFTWQPGKDYKILAIPSARKSMGKREPLYTDGENKNRLIQLSLLKSDPEIT